MQKKNFKNDANYVFGKFEKILLEKKRFEKHMKHVRLRRLLIFIRSYEWAKRK